MGITEKASIFTIAQHGDLDFFLSKFTKDSINEKSSSGSSLLHLAISGRNYDIALYLIDNGIDVNMTNSEGQTALHYVCVNQNLNVAKSILEKGGDVNIRDKYGNNAFWTAVFNCKGKNYEMVNLLCKYLPDIYSKNNAGRSPLDFAEQTKDYKLIEILTQQT